MSLASPGPHGHVRPMGQPPDQFRDPARIEQNRIETGGLANLDARSREIFRRIVDSYLATGEPVGSRHLSRLLPMTLSPASVRNVMQDLEELGLVYAPHTSAGRLPTEIGLRFFVDALLQIGDLTGDERAQIEAQVRAASRDRSFEGVLSEATSLLSGLTRGASVVVANKENVRLKQIEFVRLEPSGRLPCSSARTARSKTASSRRRAICPPRLCRRRPIS